MQADFVKKHRKIAKKVEGETERQAGENAYAGHARVDTHERVCINYGEKP